MCLIYLCPLLGRFGSCWLHNFFLASEPAHVEIVFFVRTLCNIKRIISHSSSYGSFSKIRGVGIIKSSSQFQINTLGTRKLIRESQCSRENYSNHKLVFAVQLSKRGFRVQTLLKKEEQKIVWACRNH